MKQKYRILGLMSGTSLDGIDLAGVAFSVNKGKWQFSIEKVRHIPYQSFWHTKLDQMHRGSIAEMVEGDFAYGRLLGEEVKQFMEEEGFKAQLVASHGHTIFHNPENKTTFQAGHGGIISAICQKPVVCDFRSQDMALGGQGAPLVSFGEKHLFGKYDFCLNLGGIANITCLNSEAIRAFDVAPCNLILNAIAQKAGMEYDEDGRLSKKGKVYPELLSSWERFGYYNQKPPKSLDKEASLAFFRPLINTEKYLPEDTAATWIHHLAGEIRRQVVAETTGSTGLPAVLVTGGGAFNPVLMKVLNANPAVARFIKPDDELIQYKEAVIFAFLGLMRVLNQNNVLGGATGAGFDHIAGALYGSAEDFCNKSN